MKKIDISLPEILFGVGREARSAQMLSRLVRQGKARKLGPKVYTTHLTASPAAIIHRHLCEIAGHLYPQAVLSHRSALEATPTDDGSLYLTYKYSRNVAFPGHTLRLLKGPGPLPGDRPFVGGLHIASAARAFLENLAPARSRQGITKVLSREMLETRLDRICRIHGEGALNALRDQARGLVEIGGWEREFKRLDALIGAILGTRRRSGLKSSIARARALGVPYDSPRIERFNVLFQALIQKEFRRYPVGRHGADWNTNRAFFEAYFSNYIEGARFEVGVAREVVLEGRVLPDRPADSHDIVGTFRLVSDPGEAARIPGDFQDLPALLSRRHEVFMGGRPESHPGQFKEQTNRAGRTVFVAPELVQGTLEKGFELYRGLAEPFARAAFMMFLISEVHPFDDGNGRIARIMMNAELTAAREIRIIIPTVYRDDYLGALRLFSRQGEADAYIRMLVRAQEFSVWLAFPNYRRTLAQLQQSGAFMEPGEGRLAFPA